MADPDHDGLLRRIARLAAQLTELTNCISASPNGLAITTPGNLAISCGGSAQVAVGANMVLSVGSNLTFSVASRFIMSSVQELRLEARYCNVNSSVDTKIESGKSLQMSSGTDMKVAAGKTLAIASADATTIKSGAASLDMKKNGDLALHGRDVTIVASGRLNAKASSDVVIKGSKIQQN